MKKIISLVLVTALCLSLAACGKTKPTADNSGATDVVTTPESIRILGYAAQEADLNILRDTLSKAGFEVIVNLQPDYSSFTSVVDKKEYDLALSGWTTVTGNPDYAVRDIFFTDAPYNRQGLNDPKINELIDKASTETPAEYIKTYTELENYLVKENAYIVPEYSNFRIQAINQELLNIDTVVQPKSRSSLWEQYRYNDPSLHATRELVSTQTLSNLTSLDPIQANDGSINQLSSNINVRIINLTHEDEITAKGSLSLNYAIGEGNQDYYFLLRDDVFFSKVENKQPVNTGVRVGAEDVLFSLNRAKDKNSVALHKTYGLHQHMQEISIVTDLEELANAKDSDTGKPVLDILKANVPNEIKALTNDKTKADNKAGTYQVVKVTTAKPFPQVLNYLAHQSAGIISEKQVTELNSKFEVANYDPKKDVCYGDTSAIKAGDNHLWLSGPYVLTYVDDYEVAFQKNPGYMVGTENEAQIQKIKSKFIKDEESAIAAFRSGEIDYMPAVTIFSKIDLIQSDPKLKVMQRSSNAASYAFFNLHEGSKFQDKDLRLAVLNAMDQSAFIAVKNNMVNPSYSPLSTLVETGNVLTQDLAKSKEYLAAYQAKQK